MSTVPARPSHMSKSLEAAEPKKKPLFAVIAAALLESPFPQRVPFLGIETAVAVGVEAREHLLAPLFPFPAP